MKMIITVKTCICLAFPLVYTQLCFNNPGGSISGNSVYNKEYFCCDHYEMKDEECVECNTGFTSLKGEQCKPCSQDSFGYRCTEICPSCTENERCDHIHGCISSLTTVVHPSRLTESLGSLHIDKTPTQSDRPYEKKEVTNVQNLYVYIFGGGGVSGMILLCIICYKIRSDRSTNVVITQDLETNSNEEVNGFESVYEEIDEIVLDEFIQQSNINNTNVDEISSSSSSTDKNSASNVDDYLNPYQPILQTTEHHTYRSTSDVAAVSSIERGEDHVCVHICNPTYVHVEQDECVEKSSGYPKSLYLKYSDLEIDGKQENNELGRFENSRIFNTVTLTEMRSTPQPQPSTEYAEIIHTAL